MACVRVLSPHFSNITSFFVLLSQTNSSYVPVTVAVKSVCAQINNDHPDWALSEQRVAKFVKKTMVADAAAANGTPKKAGKFKFTSPIARLKKAKAAKEESLASAIKEAAPKAAAASPVKMADIKEAVQSAKGAYEDEKDSDEPCCSVCVIS